MSRERRRRERSRKGRAVSPNKSVFWSNFVVLGLTVMVILGTVALFRMRPYGMSRAEAEALVERKGDPNAEYFYLGEEADGLHLANIVVDEDNGRMIFEYGRCMDNDEGGCNRPLNVISLPIAARAEEGVLEGNCVRIQEVLGEGNMVAIGSSDVEITYWDVIPDGYMTNFVRSRALVPQLRAVGQPAPSFCG